ncbi:MAG: hypothetical protein ACREVS_07605 [Burkholderiales bacterium]
MLKRILIVAAAALAAHSGAVLADNSWAFDDAFWSREPAMQRVEHTSYMASQANDSFKKYEQVDGYNY